MSPASRALTVAGSHPSLPGHFPGMPVVPGVVVLNYVLVELRQQLPGLDVTGIKKLKFLRMLFPDQPFSVEFALPGPDGLRFKCWQEGDLLAEGRLALSSVPHDKTTS